MPRLTRPSLVLFLCLFTSQAGLLVLSPVLPDIAREFGVSPRIYRRASEPSMVPSCFRAGSEKSSGAARA